MDKTYYEMIFRRKSFHLFRNVGNESISGAELDDIQNAYTAFDSPIWKDTYVYAILESDESIRKDSKL